MTKDSLKSTLFIDTETVAQYKTLSEAPEKVKKLWGDQYFRDEEIKAMSADERYLARAALRAEFGKAVCVSMGAVIFDDKDVPAIYIKSVTGDEKTILEKVAAATQKYARLCAHNGKGFDYGFLARRYLINGMAIPKILDTRGKKPWEIENLDTQELWRFGDMVYPSLELLAGVLGVEVGNDITGAGIHDAYYSGTIQDVAKKCANDVAGLIRVYVKLYNPTLTIDKVVLA